MRVLTIVLLGACTTKPAPQTPAPPPPAPARVQQTPTPPPVTPPAPAPSPLLGCVSQYLKDQIKVEINAHNLTGTITQHTTGTAPMRDIMIVARPSTGSTELVFADYNTRDSMTITGKRVARKERLVAGTSVVARLVVVANETRLYVDGDVDFRTGVTMPAPDGYFVCKP